MIADINVANDNHRKQITQLLEKYDGRARDLEENSEYFESGYRPQAIGLSVPPAMKNLLAKVGWPRVYLGAIEERLDIEGFRLAGTAQTDERLWSWWQYNMLDVESGLGHNEAMIHGCAMVTIAAPDPRDKLSRPDMPIIRVESPKHMYADVDPRTRRITRAIRVYDDEDGQASYTLYLPNGTYGYSNVRGKWEQSFAVEHNLGIVPVVMLSNRDRLDQLQGVSQITPELRSVTDAAARLTMDLQASAELMALPQRVIFGISQDELQAQTANGTTWEAYMARILAFGDHEGKIAQFAAAELRNFGDGMDLLTKQAASYTGLPAAYFSYTTENPASADAIRASEVRLVKKAERKQRLFGEAWEQVMKIAMLIMKVEIPDNIHQLETVWRDASTPTIAAKADAIVKLATAVTPDGTPLVPVQQARIDLEYSQEQRDQMDKWDQLSAKSRLADLFGSPPASNNSPSNNDSGQVGDR